jgi:Cu2+-exporting ATPase
VPTLALTDVREHPGAGVEGWAEGRLYRLGRADWALGTDAAAVESTDRAGVTLSEGGRPLARFRFEDELRPGTADAIAALKARRIPAEIVSGDHQEAVRCLATRLDIPGSAGVSPAGKVARVNALAAAGQKVLMVGDGLNDTPALAAAHASMAPASAADIGRNAADLVFLGNSLLAVPEAIDLARHARDLVRQNLLLAVGYNALAVPLAIAGHVTPLVAAIAMSASSIVVIGNALRLGGGRGEAARPLVRADESASLQPAAGTAR